MDYGTFLKSFFAERETYDKLTRSDKTSCRFLLNRSFAAMYPSLSNHVNGIHIDGAALCDAWSTAKDSLGIKSFPQVWPKKGVQKKKEWTPKRDEIFYKYLAKQSISSREFDERLKWDPEGTRDKYQKFLSYHKE